VPNSALKGKRKREGTSQVLNSESEDAIEFEVYHVRCILPLELFHSSFRSDDMAYSRFQGLPSQNATVCSSLH